MPANRRVRDLIVHDTKERPHARALILREGWTPQILGDSSGRYWDGFTVRDKDGQRQTVGGDSLRKEIARMAAWGEFGDDVANAFIDGDRYYQIQNLLLEWPDPDAIRREGLYHLAPVRSDRSVK